MRPRWVYRGGAFSHQPQDAGADTPCGHQGQGDEERGRHVGDQVQ